MNEQSPPLMVESKELSINPEDLWLAADKLRGTVDSSDYKHVVLGLIFLKYISDAFEARRAELATELTNEGISGTEIEPLLESRDEYTAEGVFWVPQESRWSELQANGRHPNLGKLIDDAMYAIERDNPKLKGKLPRDYARRSIPSERLGGLIDQIASIAIGTKDAQRKDILGRVYEFFLGKFAAAEGKLGGEFFTPSSVVRLMVEMIEPYEGRVYDPACGSGGMFVQSERFAEAHGGSKRDLSVFGQESNATTWRLAHMNLAIRGIEANLGDQPADSFTRDLHPDLKVDYILANPPFNISDWSGQLLRNDVRWKYGVPPVGNANYAWIQHFIHHLAPPNGRGGGTAAFVMANGSLSSSSSEAEIRKNIIDADLVDCVVALPSQLFLTTGIPVCLWFVTRDKTGKHLAKGKGGRDRRGETLFIDARDMGAMETRVLRYLTGRDSSESPPPPDTDIGKIVQTYHAWRGEVGANQYADLKGFSKAATIAEIAAKGHVLTPGTFVGSKKKSSDSELFNDKMARLVSELSEQMLRSEKLNGAINTALATVGFGFDDVK
ncbi:type I restriction-modification system subunit M [Neorhizobium alkalisoli]|uniref:site-specific DNA-methyltransferase (adenine-specific) n=1 Tax=Neorhizobium alkalisoli TaxID=528178 RepID=A0A561Q860_9HYPH|nr:class I SAM-dependent DNA methyltransferase [Neorhizobium alkalisoli]TWF46558.1 type I restriction enzyme M protein [Neorhizobium alkalisoli]